MKSIIKLIGLSFIVLCFNGCSETSDLGFNPDTEVGWIQLGVSNDAPATLEYQQSFDVVSRVGVNIQVPNVENDLMIGYDLVSVSGLNPNSVFSNNGSIMSPAGLSSYAGPSNGTGFEFDYTADIVFDFEELPSLTEPMVFDVVLTSSNDPNVTVGFNNEKPITQRVRICPAQEDLFLGEYNISSEGDAGTDVGLGISLGGTVLISEGPDGPLSRTFDATYWPNTAPQPLTITFNITPDGYLIVSDDYVSTLQCIATPPGGVGIAIGGSTSPSPLECTDDSLTLNILEFKYVGDDPEDVDDEEDLVGGGGCLTDFGDMNAEVTIILEKV